MLSQVPASANATASASFVCGPPDGGDVVIGQGAVGQAALGEQADRIALAPFFDFVLPAVELGIEHRMRTEPICAELQEEGAAVAADPVGRGLGGVRQATTSIPSTAAVGTL